MSKYIEMNIPLPRWQGAAALGLGFLMMLIGKGFAKSELFPWLVSGATLLLFMVGNNLLAIFSDSFAKYFQESMMVFVALLLSLGMLAYLLSGLGIREAGTYRTIYIIFIMAYFTMAGMCSIVRSVVDFLLRKDQHKGHS